ncbi:MAG TPA: 2Fe-2S iron-sulfur cluster-binding protein [Steroidobacteraceae bacterium]|jgi:ring-1,2-phenylacetyl-CoA epoxidase subunit PaaE|nr:2Fe-2S iron-sulfur cluster-binding protein [Steroidobacteraceae bacterium]
MLRFHSLRVAQVQAHAEDAVALALEVPAELAAEYRGVAGQHVVLRATLAGEEVRRTYSLVNAPGEPLLRIVVRVHSDGRLSTHLAQHVRPGDLLEVLPPNGSFTPHAAAGRGTCVAFAAGCGITPVVSIARSWLETAPTGRVILFYGNRAMARAMCLEELLALKDRYLDRLSLHFLMSREPQEAEIYNGRLDAEHIRQLGASFFAPAEIAECFVCGPGDMIDTVSHTLRQLGVQSDRIRAEHFTVATANVTQAQGSAPPPQMAEPGRAGGPDPALAEVTIVMDGRRRSFTMPMNGETILDAAARAGLDLPFSCRAGVCSTCRTKVVRGEVAMDQNYALEEWELQQGYVLACQSRVKTPVLELDYDEV